ncbi:Branched-chain amino acid transport ATP-binding protein LivF (TC 3.A.1.4.1) [hydrothermal vent metagenome]|uniref:Branched-chain amino acid transport ATP-binding protein LivF (TC 3.A.1.4.1) n=1 Tax=hydrothermal vent metagenome TaxID=652676 RepID=A0A3B0SVK2_9ZZZZ
MLHVQDVQAYYGDSHILQGVDLEVGEGEVVALLGRNGMGKTTTISAIMGLVPPRSGSIRFHDEELVGRPPFEIANLGIGLVPQGRRLFPELSVRENLTLASRPGRNGGRWTLERIHDLFPILDQRGDVLAGRLSGGEQQMAAIARALLTNPRLVLLDEPSEGLAPLIVEEIGRVIAELRTEGLSILLVEQHIPMATGVADRVYIMSKGTMAYEGTPGELLADDEARAKHLGV